MLYKKILTFLNKKKKMEYTKIKITKKERKNMKVIDTIALILIIIGAINWGLIGLFNFNLVDTIFGTMSIISRIIYILVGISGVWGIKLIFDKNS